MRVRHNSNAETFLKEVNNICIDNPKEYIGKWNKIFENENPLHVEIGMGKGKFIYQMAKRYPDINFIGIERNKTIMALAIKRYLDNSDDKLNNLRYISIDAENITEIFDKCEIDKIYLNFSDPWPKTKHEKRRLTYRSFLDKYKVLLKEKGILQLKTDNVSLFDFSVVEMNNYIMKFEAMAVDLHKSKHAEENIMTEYEEKFSNKGQPIFMIRGRF